MNSHERPRHRYEMESPLNGFYVECAHRFADGTVCHRLPEDACHAQ